MADTNTAIKGLNLDAIRELNKIRIFAVKKDKLENVMDAYLTSPLGSFSNKVTASSLTQSVGEFLGQSKLASWIGKSVVGNVIKDFGQGKSTIGNILGTGLELSNEINYNYNYRFTGTDVFQKTFTCELVMKDDWYKDVINPLWKLLDYVLPNESRQLHETNAYQVTKESAGKLGDKIKQGVNDFVKDIFEQDTLDAFWKYMGDLGGTVDNMLGGLSFFKKPKQLHADNLKTRIQVGNYIVIDDVIIDSIGFDIPYLYYENGLFDKVSISLSVIGNRKMSLNTYDWIRGLTTMKHGDLVSEDFGKKKDVLNELYNYKDTGLKPSNRKR